eukprot:CAMPEP_0171022042 /NCGR_PEP_ID=MMETSP0736-20130129/31112_1 /TAXON_ID=186038 /ORGANISM="Fragilariopsis kerguelensis, Strain L26-C5" /LENGTH=156 /DNA_ID=CAMNT_0011460633 /DNA_START=558 /DNA_END=1025 /DNA_ORIENTATION=+
MKEHPSSNKRTNPNLPAETPLVTGYIPPTPPCSFSRGSSHNSSSNNNKVFLLSQPEEKKPPRSLRRRSRSKSPTPTSSSNNSSSSRSKATTKAKAPAALEERPNRAKLAPPSRPPLPSGLSQSISHPPQPATAGQGRIGAVPRRGSAAKTLTKKNV